ncbi:uncharacterized protein Tsen2 [Hetaerina americana]|uniref:uncharacterized protein Tsen2 n=1 Tax=Hetaerina americana TaxID=62018 RepID=UPI003A7F5730
MHKESSGFRRRTLLEDPPRAEVEVVDGVESTTTGNLGSDCCEVAPCIVIPDSDSEPEETQESPRLESDPSIFLPSLDALQLIPEEAFFLAYGLGCLVVWDGRNSDLLSGQFDDDKDGEDASVLIDETLSSDACSSQSSGAVKKGNDVGKMGNAPSSSMKENGEGCPHDGSSTTSDCGVDGSSESKKRCDLGYCPGSPSKGSITLMTIEEDENMVVDPSKVDSEKDLVSKSPVKEIEEPPAASDGTTHSPSMKVPSGEASEEGPGVGDTPDNVGKTSIVTQDCESVEGISASDVKNTANQVPANACDQQNKNDSTSVISDSVSIVYDAGSDGKTSSQSRKQKFPAGEGDGDKTMPCSPHQSGEISDPDDAPLKENGDLDSSSITIIDLADSPPHSRQWSRKGWSSHEEEDVAVVEADVQQSMPDHPSEKMLSSKYQRPMSILELWNAFRSSRASIPSSTVPFEISYAVYHHFRSKRWVVKPGIRFGGDFLLYKDGPPFYHASYLVVIDSFDADGESKFDWKMLSGMNRLTENIAKDLMLCRVEWPSTMTEGELQSPECLSGVVVQEVLVRRWVSIRERDSDHQLEEKDIDDRDSFIPLKL